jgi:hypothetical protein
MTLDLLKRRSSRSKGAEQNRSKSEIRGRKREERDKEESDEYDNEKADLPHERRHVKDARPSTIATKAGSQKNVQIESKPSTSKGLVEKPAKTSTAKHANAPARSSEDENSLEWGLTVSDVEVMNKQGCPDLTTVWVDGNVYYFNATPTVYERQRVSAWMTAKRPSYEMCSTLVRDKRIADVGMKFGQTHMDPLIIPGTKGFKLENHFMDLIFRNQNLLCHILQDSVILGKLSANSSFMHKVASLPSCKSALACIGGISSAVLTDADSMSQYLTTTSVAAFPEALKFLTSFNAFCRQVADIPDLVDKLRFLDEVNDESRTALRKKLYKIAELVHFIETSSAPSFDGLEGPVEVLPSPPRVKGERENQTMFDSHTAFLKAIEKYDTITVSTLHFSSAVENNAALVVPNSTSKVFLAYPYWPGLSHFATCERVTFQLTSAQDDELASWHERAKEFLDPEVMRSGRFGSSTDEICVFRDELIRNIPKDLFDSFL